MCFPIYCFSIYATDDVDTKTVFLCYLVYVFCHAGKQSHALITDK